MWPRARGSRSKWPPPTPPARSFLAEQHGDRSTIRKGRRCLELANVGGDGEHVGYRDVRAPPFKLIEVHPRCSDVAIQNEERDTGAAE